MKLKVILLFYFIFYGAQLAFAEDNAFKQKKAYDLSQAIKSNDIDLVKIIIDAGADVNYDICPECENNEIAFYTALKEKNWKILRYLLNNGSDLNESAIILLKSSNDNNELEILKTIFEKGYPLKENYILLFHAWNSGNKDTFEYVFERGNFDVNKVIPINDNDNKSLFYYSVLYNNLDKIKNIHQAGGEITPDIVIATIKRGNEDIFLYIEKHVIDKNSIKQLFKTDRIDWYNRSKRKNFSYDYLGYLTYCSPDHCMAAPKIVQKLLEYGVDPNHAIGYKVTPLEEVIVKDYGSDEWQHRREDMIFYLLDAGADVNTITRNSSPVLSDIAFNRPHLLKRFILYKPRVPDDLILNIMNTKSRRNQLSCLTGNDRKESTEMQELISTITYLIDGGANIKNNDILTVAAHNSLTEIVDILIQKGASVDFVSSFGMTPLMMISSLSRKDFCAFTGYNPSESAHIFHLLIKAGANLNSQDENGQTALIHAIVQGNLSGLQILIDAGADTAIKDNNGYSALTHAKLMKKKEMVYLLNK